MTDEEYRKIQEKIEIDKNSLTTGSNILLPFIVCLLLFCVGMIFFGMK